MTSSKYIRSRKGDHSDEIALQVSLSESPHPASTFSSFPEPAVFSASDFPGLRIESLLGHIPATVGTTQFLEL